MVQEIEGEEHDAVRRLVDGRPEGFKVGQAVFILDDDLPIDRGALHESLLAASTTWR